LKRKEDTAREKRKENCGRKHKPQSLSERLDLQKRTPADCSFEEHRRYSRGEKSLREKEQVPKPL
jgi:hypothetical protein